jgi:hypothetical protein
MPRVTVALSFLNASEAPLLPPCSVHGAKVWDDSAAKVVAGVLLFARTHLCMLRQVESNSLVQVVVRAESHRKCVCRL